MVTKSGCAALAAAGLAVSVGAFGALAADMPVKAPPRAVVTTYAWTGAYLGFNLGYGWADRTATFAANDPLTNLILSGTFIIPQSTPAGPAGFNVDGVTGGFQAGYNWQINQRWVSGIELDFNGSAIKGDGRNTFVLFGFAPNQVFASLTAEQKLSWYGTIRARLGWLATDSLLLFGTAGLAYGRIKETAAYTQTAAGSNGNGGFSMICAANVPCMTGSSSRTEVGFAVGAGTEFAATRNVTFKIEYLYMNLGNGGSYNIVAQNVAPALAAASMRVNTGTLDFHNVRFGVNYRFN